MEYRIAKKKDLKELALMRWEFKTEGKVEISSFNKVEFLEVCNKFFEEEFENKTWTHWVAVSEGKIVSHISVNHIKKIPKPSMYEDYMGYLTNVFTRLEYRGQGIGSELINRVIEWSKDENLELLFVWPSPKAIDFYERKGFKDNNEIMEYILREDY